MRFLATIFKLAFLGFLVFVGIATYFRQESTEEMPHLRVNLDDFYTEGESNEVALQEKLNGHLLEVQGYVGSISMSFGIPEVSLVTPGGNLKASVSDAKKVATLSQDQQVDLLCRELKYSGTLGSHGRDCQIVSSGETKPGITRELARIRDNKSANKIVLNALSDSIKNFADDIQGAASAIASQKTASEPAPPTATATTQDQSATTLESEPPAASSSAASE